MARISFKLVLCIFASHLLLVSSKSIEPDPEEEYDPDYAQDLSLGPFVWESRDSRKDDENWKKVFDLMDEVKKKSAVLTTLTDGAACDMDKHDKFNHVFDAVRDIDQKKYMDTEWMQADLETAIEILKEGETEGVKLCNYEDLKQNCVAGTCKCFMDGMDVASGKCIFKADGPCTPEEKCPDTYECGMNYKGNDSVWVTCSKENYVNHCGGSLRGDIEITLNIEPPNNSSTKGLDECCSCVEKSKITEVPEEPIEITEEPEDEDSGAANLFSVFPLFLCFVFAGIFK